MAALQEQTGSIDVTAMADHVRLAIAGDWTLKTAGALYPDVEHIAADIVRRGQARTVVIDLHRLDRLDVSGAWLVYRIQKSLTANGLGVTVETSRDADRILLDAVGASDHPAVPSTERSSAVDVYVGGVGRAMIGIATDLVELLEMLGDFVIALGRTIAQPRKFRLISTIHHLEHTGLRAVPIIALMSFLIGGIIAQQGAFQLRRFGAELFAVDLSAILVLREIGVLLAAIMVAGRSGSAITAEIGSMKMREEVDALRVLALDPRAVLVVPRLLALILALPLLTVIGDLAALIGAGLTSWAYSGVNPELFMERLSDAVTPKTFLIGLVKAPFFALLIGIIAAREGFKVEGSAESLGQRVTASVVKSIFIVIVLDGVFAIFFASVGW